MIQIKLCSCLSSSYQQRQPTQRFFEECIQPLCQQLPVLKQLAPHLKLPVLELAVVGRSKCHACRIKLLLELIGHSLLQPSPHCCNPLLLCHSLLRVSLLPVGRRRCLDVRLFALGSGARLPKVLVVFLLLLALLLLVLLLRRGRTRLHLDPHLPALVHGQLLQQDLARFRHAQLRQRLLARDQHVPSVGTDGKGNG